jgi:hypothetical protein
LVTARSRGCPFSVEPRLTARGGTKKKTADRQEQLFSVRVAERSVASKRSSPCAPPVRANARVLPEATDPSTVFGDGLFLALRAEIEGLKATRWPLENTANALYAVFEKSVLESGFEAACAWGAKVGLDPRLDEIEQIDRRAGQIIEQMLELVPKTPASIAAAASALKEEALGHLWDQSEGDRDWDVALLTRFLDGLISLLPRTAKHEERLRGVV